MLIVINLLPMNQFYRRFLHVSRSQLHLGQRNSHTIAGATRHIFLCCGADKHKCCSSEEGKRSWTYLKARLKELKSQKTLSGVVLRTQANCFQVCKDGPIAVIYPEGTWYRNCDESAIDNIIQSHLIDGKIYLPNVFENKNASGT